MYKIGEFSKITSLSIKTLRYYHEQEIIVPTAIDEDTGYRIYSDEQLDTAEMVRTLRDMDFSIKEVKEIMESCDDISDLSYFMEEKMDEIEEKIRNLKKIQKDMNEYIKNRDVLKKLNDYKVIRKDIDGSKIISIRFRGRYSDIGSYVSTLYKAAKQYTCGDLFNIYYDKEYKDDDADIEVCLPVRTEIFSKDVTCRELLKEEVLSLTHNGPYENIGNAYRVMFDYIEKNKISIKDESRVIFHKGPGLVFKGNPNKYISEIQILINKGKE